MEVRGEVERDHLHYNSEITLKLVNKYGDTLEEKKIQVTDEKGKSVIGKGRTVYMRIGGLSVLFGISETLTPTGPHVEITYKAKMDKHMKSVKEQELAIEIASRVMDERYKTQSWQDDGIVKADLQSEFDELYEESMGFIEAYSL